MTKAIIIDDEQLSRSIIVKYLEHHSDITVVAQCNNGFEGLKAIQTHQPDLIFLDIQMPKINGFEMLELLDYMPVVVFSTAYDQYAIKAFELSAVDYLLKPYTQARFDEALAKAKTKTKQTAPLTKQEVAGLAQQHQQATESSLSRIVVKVGTKIHIVPVTDITYIEAQDDYVAIHTDGQKYLKQMTMKYLESHLPAKDFVRVHRSYIVEVSQINKLELYGKDSHKALLQNGQWLPVSRNGYGVLKKILGF